jgi:hypothetical protein
LKGRIVTGQIYTSCPININEKDFVYIRLVFNKEEKKIGPKQSRVLVVKASL